MKDIACLAGLAALLVFTSLNAAGPSTSRPVASQAATALATTRSADSDGRLQIGIRLLDEKLRYRRDEPVKIRFTAKNVSEEPVAIWSRSCSFGHVYSFLIAGADRGIWLDEACTGTSASGPSSKELAPGESFSVDFDLTEFIERPVLKLPVHQLSRAFLQQGPPRVPPPTSREYFWGQMQGTVLVHGVYVSVNWCKGNPNWPKLQNVWEGRLMTKPIEVTLGQATSQPVLPSKIDRDKREIDTDAPDLLRSGST